MESVDMEKIGIMLILVGISAADSDALWIPAVIVLMGMFLTWKGERS